MMRRIWRCTVAARDGMWGGPHPMPRVVEMRLGDVLDFANPQGTQHSPSLFYLLALAEYGPLRGGTLVSGSPGGARPMSRWEIVPMLERYRARTDAALRFVRRPERFHHPLNHEILAIFNARFRSLPRRQAPCDPVLTAESTITYDDYCAFIEGCYERIVADMCA